METFHEREEWPAWAGDLGSLVGFARSAASYVEQQATGQTWRRIVVRLPNRRLEFETVDELLAKLGDDEFTEAESTELSFFNGQDLGISAWLSRREAGWHVRLSVDGRDRGEVRELATQAREQLSKGASASDPQEGSGLAGGKPGIRAEETAVAKVERANPPRTWTHWAASREDVAGLVGRASEVLRAQTGAEVRHKIDVGGYERAFESAEEFLDHVDEEEWRERRFVEVVLSSGDHPSMLFAVLRITAPPRGEVGLTIFGATRRDRNAVEPDLVEAVRRFERSKVQTRLRAATLVLLAVAAVWALQVGSWVALEALGGTEPVQLAVSVLVTVVPVALAGWGMIRAYRLVGAVEFLPDDRVPTWERTRKSAVAIAVAAFTVLGGAAALVTLILQLAK